MASSLRFRSSMHFEFIFVYGVKEGFHFTQTGKTEGQDHGAGISRWKPLRNVALQTSLSFRACWELVLSMGKQQFSDVGRPWRTLCPKHCPHLLACQALWLVKSHYGQSEEKLGLMKKKRDLTLREMQELTGRVEKLESLRHCQWECKRV